MMEWLLTDSSRKRKPILGRTEIQIGILWLVQCLLEGNSGALRVLREAGSVASVAGVLCALAVGVGSVGFLVLWIRKASLQLSDSSVFSVVSAYRVSSLTSNHQVGPCH